MDISFVVPVHNGLRFIKNTINSLTIPHSGISSELVIVDDGSTDGTRDLLENTPKSDGVKIIFNNKNLGAGASRNIGFREVSGRYTMFLDADDEPYFYNIVSALKVLDSNPNADSLILFYKYDDGRKWSWKGMSVKDEYILKKILGRNPSAITNAYRSPDLTLISNYPWNKIIRTDSFKKNIGYFSEKKVNNDILAHWQTMIDSREVIVLNKISCRHMVDRKSTTNITNEISESRLDMFLALEELRCLLIKKECFDFFMKQYWELSVSLIDHYRRFIPSQISELYHEKEFNLYKKIQPGDLRRIRKESPKTCMIISKNISKFLRL